jgi:uncharacterized membrane protein YGL010W
LGIEEGGQENLFNRVETNQAMIYICHHLGSTLALYQIIRRRASVPYGDIHGEGNSMTVLVICWTAVWVAMGIYIAYKKGLPKVRTIVDALLLGPFVLLLFLAKETKQK